MARERATSWKIITLCSEKDLSETRFSCDILAIFGVLLPMAPNRNWVRCCGNGVAILAMILGLSSSTLANVRLAFDSTSLDFGDVAVFAAKDLTFEVQDTAAIPLEIASITTTGTDASEFSILSPAPPVVLNPGTIATQFIVRFSPQALGVRSAVLAIETTDGIVNIPLTGIGSGKQSSLAWAHANLDVGTISPGSERDSTIELYSTGTDSSLVAALELAAADTSFAAQIMNHAPPPFMLAPGDSVAVRIAFRGLPPTGLKSAQLSATGSTLNTPSCNLSGDVEYGSFEVVPYSIMTFGTMYYGQLRDSTIYVIDSGMLDLIFDDFSLSPSADDFTITNAPSLPYTLRAGDTLALTIQANPGKNTLHRASFQAVSFSAGSHLIQSQLTVNAIPPPLSSSTSHTLEYFCASGSAVRDSIRLQDTGKIDVIITGMRFSDTALGLQAVVPLPDTIRSNTGKEISFVFNPSTTRSDTLVLQLLGGMQVMLADTFTVQPSVLPAMPNVVVASESSNAENLAAGASISLTALSLDTVIVELHLADTNIASLDPASITVNPLLGSVVITRIEPVPGGDRVTLASPTPITADSGAALLEFSLDRFVSISDSTALSVSIQTPERAGCIAWATDTVMVNGSNVCGSSILRSQLTGKPLILDAAIRQNPASGSQLSLRIMASAEGAVRFEISNTLGEVVREGSITILEGLNDCILPLAAVPGGAYSLRLEPVNGLPVTLRFIKLE